MLAVLEIKAEELNALIGEDLIGHQQDLLGLEERSLELQSETVEQLQSLALLTSTLEDRREDTMRMEFEKLSGVNTANTNRVIDSFKAAEEAAMEGQEIASAAAKAEAERLAQALEIAEANAEKDRADAEAIAAVTLSLTNSIRDELSSLNATMNGSGGGAVIQNPEQSITSI